MSVVGSNALAGASGQADAAGYEIERSLRFDDSADSNLSRTFSAGNQKKWTWSAWVKRSKLVSNNYLALFTAPAGGGNDGIFFRNDAISVSYGYAGTGIECYTSSIFRDPSAWYHIVVAVDSDQSTAANRLKIWVNNQLHTLNQYPGSGQTAGIGAASLHHIGLWKNGSSTNYPFGGLLADVHFIDGQQLTASDFGEYDNDNNWNPKEYAGSYDQSVGGTTIANSTGAVPILNTSDADGQTVSSGVRSDSNSSSIVLALPLNGSNGGTTITDYHHTIKGSGSAKTVSIYTGSASGGAVTSTAVSKYYGSSFYVVRGGTNNYTASDYIYRDGDSDLDLGTGSFCVEFWYYPTSFTGNSGIFDNRHPSTSWPNDANGFALIVTGNGTIFSYSGGNQIINHSTALTAGQWNHIAYTRDGSTERLFINGNFFGTTASSSRNYNRQRFYLGTTANNGEGSDGYYQDFRMYKGVAKYTANFTPPELGSGGVNSFHLKFADNASDAALGTDSSGLSNTFTVNNLSAASQTSSTGKSWFFDGSSGIDANDSRLALGTGDWTVEYFILPWSNYNNQSAHVGYAGNNPYFETDGSAQVRWQVGSVYGSSLTYPNWYHVAHVADGGQGAIWVNGTQIATNLAMPSNFDSTDGRLRIGQRVDGTVGARALFSNVHIVVGTAKYKRSQSTIPIPHTPIPLHPDTQLLALTTTDRTEDVSNNNITLTVTSGAGITVNNPPDIGENIYSDSMVDSPTNYEADSGNNRGNYATFNPLHLGLSSNSGVANSASFSDGNLKAVGVSAKWAGAISTMAIPASGKWYFEFTCLGSNSNFGLFKPVYALNGTIRTSTNSKGAWYGSDGNVYYYVSSMVTDSTQPGTYTTNDIIGIAVDSDAFTVKYYKNNALQYTQTLVSALQTELSEGNLFAGVDTYNGVDAVADFGQMGFTYTPPSGYKSLCTQNLSDPTIADGSTAMDATLWTGNGTSQTISGLNHSPDLAWVKARSFGADHEIYDIVRGASKRLYTSLTNAESTASSSVNSFTSDGFTVTGGGGVNNNTSTYVGWVWDAGSSTVSNTDGSINSSVRANPSAGISIVTWTGTSANGTIGHGLNAAPEFVIVKKRGGTGNWYCYHSGLTDATKYIWLNSTAAENTQAAAWNSTAPTSTVVHLGAEGEMNANGVTSVAYCFAPVSQFSSFGSYIANGLTDGPFVFTGMRPKFILAKIFSGNTDDWVLYDAERSSSNAADDELYPNQASAEVSGSRPVDILSNGFKIRNNSNKWNGASGYKYIYAAFAEHPFKTARAR